MKSCKVAAGAGSVWSLRSKSSLWMAEAVVEESKKWSHQEWSVPEEYMRAAWTLTVDPSLSQREDPTGLGDLLVGLVGDLVEVQLEGLEVVRGREVLGPIVAWQQHLLPRPPKRRQLL